MPLARRVLAVAACGSLALGCAAAEPKRTWSERGSADQGTPIFEVLQPAAAPRPSSPQKILVLDMRSGWWSGGGGGTFYNKALPAVAQAVPGTRVEYHHFEVSRRIRCVVEGITAPECVTTSAPVPSTPAEISALFERPHWDDYTQLWLLSGSDVDDTDVRLASALFQVFLEETRSSCIPVMIGAGDGFITHGNALAKVLGIGEVLSSDFPSPGFFSVTGNSPITVESRMWGGQELLEHALFQGVYSVVDTIATWGEGTHGDIVAEDADTYQVIAHDTAGRPSIAVGSSPQLSGGRPFIIDAGFQRFYGMKAHEGTWLYLRNIVEYLANVGCKAEPTK